MAVVTKYIEMVGRLAKDDEIKQYGRTAVFINKPGDIQYKVKSLSIKNDITEELFTGYISSIRNLDFVDDQYGDSEDRIKAFSEHYAKSLFVFSHKIDAMGNYKIDVADIVTRSSKISDNSQFIAIPCFSSKTECDSVNTVQLFRTYNDYSQFIHLLLEGKSLGRIYNYQINESTNFPEFIIWSEPTKMCAIGPIKSATRSAMDSLLLQVSHDAYCEISLDEEDDDTAEYMIHNDNNPTLIHLAAEKYLDIVNRMSQKLAETQVTKAEQPSSGTQVSLVVDAPAGTNPAPSEDATETTPIVQEQTVEDIRELPIEKTESAILEFFRYHSQKNRLFYAPKDITNFHTAIKTGSLVILSGMSGTGKSALVDTYAKALGIGKNVLVIPVRPSWNDDSDLLGYVDLIHMVYRPSDTGFINKIVEAAQPENKDKMYLICLDEMNLARVEHYFSQFLSILEKPVGSRELVLYDEQYAGQLYNSSKYPQHVSLGDNVRFIGTVNIDESTYHFSDKVLDRANVISLDVLNYSNPSNWKEDKYRAANTPEWTNADFKELIKQDDVSIINQSRTREFLWEMHTLLHTMNASLGVGPRIVKSIEAYLRNIPECENEYALSVQEGLDYQVAQRILTKIRGPEEQLKDLFHEEDSNRNALVSLLDNFSDISAFERCRKAIKQKEKELRVYGYCL